MDGQARPNRAFSGVGAHFVRRVMSKRAPVTQQASSGRARVSVVQPANVRNGDHGSAPGRFNLAWGRRVAVQRLMGARDVIVIEIIREDVFQVRFVQHDHVVQAFAADRADQPFNVGILPRRTRSADDFFNSGQRKRDRDKENGTGLICTWPPVN